MSASSTDIANLALSFIGNGDPIQDMTEDSAEAQACLLFYDVVRDECLGEFPWSFAKRSQSLGTAIEEDPNSDWAFSYRLPADVLTILKVWGAVRNPTLDEEINYETGSDATGGLVYTDQADAEIKYVAREETVSKWPQEFATAVAYRLASRIAMRLVKEDKIGMSERMEFQATRHMAKAKAKDRNNQRPDPPPDSEIITSRGGY